MTVRTRNLRNAAICKVGRWKGLFGPVEVTREKLQSVVDAYNDPEVVRPKLRIGHISSMNTALGDGAPALGWIENPRLDGDTLRGDLVDVPEKLAGLIGRAYRTGSIEMRHNVTTPSGKHYPAAMKAFAVLGDADPAVKGMDPLPKIENLEDLVDLYASESPDGIDDDATQESVDTVMLGELDSSLIPTPQVGRGDTGVQDPGEPGDDTKEGPSMAFLEDARIKLGLPDDATEADILAKLDAPKTETPDPEPKAEKPEAPVVEEPKVEAALSAPDTVQVSRAVWDEVQADLRHLKADAAKRHRAEVMDAALSEGRIVPAEREKWETALSAAPEATETLLSQLPARVSTVETGADTALSSGAEDIDEWVKNYRAVHGLDS